MPRTSALKPRLSAGRVLAGAAVVALAGLLTVGTASAQIDAPPASATQAPASHPAKSKQAPATQPSKSGLSTQAKAAQASAQAKRNPKVTRYHPDRFAGRAGTYYRLVWGVDDLVVKWGESGEVIRFSYHVLDADKARILNDKKNEPSLIDPRAGVKLVVPSLENVGQLRQSVPPENGKSYWMVFSNKGRLVKRGDHVAVVIGAFHADGLVVD